MLFMEEKKSVISCNICNKIYKSKNSLGNHNRKFHKNIQNVKSQHSSQYLSQQKSIIGQHLVNNLNNKKQCNLCNKFFSHKQSLWIHQKNSCKFKNNINSYAIF